MASALLEMISYKDINKIFFSKILELLPYQQILESCLALLCLEVVQRMLHNCKAKTTQVISQSLLLEVMHYIFSSFPVFRCFECFFDICFDKQFFNLTIYLICLLVGFFYFAKFIIFNLNFFLIQKWVAFQSLLNRVLRVLVCSHARNACIIICLRAWRAQVLCAYMFGVLSYLLE